MQSLRLVDRRAVPDDPRLCLFNVLVALEWVPDEAYMRQLEWAFRRASDFLYDVSDGAMAFGQVVFGGPELMDSADIQIMATTEGKSELITHAVGSSAKRKSEEWGIIQARFPWLNPSAQSLEGPGRLPLPLPRLYRLGALAEAAPAQARHAGLLLRAFPPELRLDNCWVYVLPSMDGGKAPARVIAQGTLEARSAEDGFQLLGAGQGDTIVLIGKDRHDQTAIFRGLIDVALADGQALASVAEWRDATPRAFPQIAVVPDRAEPEQKLARVSVRIDSPGAPPDQAWLFPLGQVAPADVIALGAPDRRDWASAIQDVPTLDGHVLLRWRDGGLLISSFSQGGGPTTTSPFPANPITAGSSDGAAALYFYDGARAEAYATDPGGYATTKLPITDYSGLKLITTVIHGIARGMPAGARARSQVVSLASNAALPMRIAPTLTLYYDSLFRLADERELLAGDLRICRLVDGAWTPLPTYLPAGYPFAVAPLNLETAGTLVADSAQVRIEYYRILWIPRA